MGSVTVFLESLDLIHNRLRVGGLFVLYNANYYFMETDMGRFAYASLCAADIAASALESGFVKKYRLKPSNVDKTLPHDCVFFQKNWQQEASTPTLGNP